MVEMSKAFAERLGKEAADDAARIDRAWKLAFARSQQPVGDAEQRPGGDVEGRDAAAAEVGPAVGENEGFALSHPAGLAAVVGPFHVAGLRVEAVKADDGGRVEALEASVASVVVGASAGPGTRTARGRRLTRSL
jgi:hypothetical protein